MAVDIRSAASGAVLVGGAVLFVAMAWFAVVGPWLAWRNDSASQMYDTAGKIAQFRAIATRATGTGEQLEAEIAQRYGDEYLRGESDAIILADLQALIGRIVSESDSTVVLARPMPARDVGGLRQLGLYVQISGDIRSLFRVVHRIESGKPYLFLENATVKLMEGAGLSAAEGGEMIQTLVELEVYGVLWPDGSAAGAGQ